jgi:hypothetical protein
MYLEQREHTPNDCGDEIALKPLKTDYRSIKRIIHRAATRLDQDITSDEEESTEKCFHTRAKDTKKEETARQGRGRYHSTLLSVCSSIFITTTVRYHGDNKHITHRERKPERGITLKALVKNRGGHR